jgi:hypothetical protein
MNHHLDLRKAKKTNLREAVTFINFWRKKVKCFMKK